MLNRFWLRRTNPWRCDSRKRLAAFALLWFLFLNSTPAQLHAQTATVTGVVLADSSEQPLPNAEISFPQLNLVARSDSTGLFTVRNVKPGRQRMRIRLVGYESFESWLVLADKQTLDAEFLLKRATTLATVRTEASAARTVREKEFEENRKGLGRYLKADVFAAGQGRNMASILQANMPGIRTLKTSGDDEFLTAGRETGRDCLMQVYLNGLMVYTNGRQPFNINSINSADVVGFEYYTPLNTPARYNGFSPGCGTVLIWTK